MTINDQLAPQEDTPVEPSNLDSIMADLNPEVPQITPSAETPEVETETAEAGEPDVDLEELKKGYLRHQDYTKKRMEEAAVVKAEQQRSAKLQAELDALKSQQSKPFDDVDLGEYETEYDDPRIARIEQVLQTQDRIQREMLGKVLEQQIMSVVPQIQGKIDGLEVTPDLVANAVSKYAQEEFQTSGGIVTQEVALTALRRQYADVLIPYLQKKLSDQQPKAKAPTVGSGASGYVAPSNGMSDLDRIKADLQGG